MPAREPFPYESNGPLFRQILTPDPIPTQAWEEGFEEWEAHPHADSLLEWLIKSGTIREDEFLNAIGNALGVETLTHREARECGDNTPAAQLLRTQGYVVLESSGSRKWITGGPELKPKLEKLLGANGKDWKWVFISPLRNVGGDAGREEKDNPDIYSVKEWLEELLTVQWSGRAADIHFEREGEQLTVRAHLSGRMRSVGTWNDERVQAALRLLKTWAGFSTAAQTLPQDGRISLKMSSRTITFRTSHIMTVNGESIVLRNLGSEKEIRTLGELNMPTELKERLLDCTLHDPGLIICSGPTGSGKTTTQYALLRELENRNLKILTIEDPVEYEVPFAVQSVVDSGIGWTFDAAIRAYLRQDPDIILLGEIRDRESAQAACRAALTGHCVLTTLHARSVEATLERFMAWGVSKDLLSETVRMIVNQRLVPEQENRTLRADFRWSDQVATG